MCGIGERGGAQVKKKNMTCFDFFLLRSKGGWGRGIIKWDRDRLESKIKME